MNNLKFRIWLSDIKNKSNQQMIYGDISQKKSWKELWENYNLWLGNIKIIQQFTGLQDKNGKDIYEEDIVKKFNQFSLLNGENEYILNIVKWNSNKACFINIYNNHSLEVVGNIFENLELLYEII